MTDNPGGAQGRRSALLTAWATPEEKALVEEAARESDVSPSAILRAGGLAEARRILGEKKCPRCGTG